MIKCRQLVIGLLCGLALVPVAAQAEYPEKPIEVVVPFAAGGGTDSLTRTVANALEKRISQPVAVINVPGAAGILGSRQIKEAPPTGYKLLVSHETLLTAAAQGTADYGPEAFEPIAQTATSDVVVAVDADSPYKSLDDLIQAAKKHPNEIKIVTNIGAVAHYAWLMLADAAGGVAFRYIQSGGGADRLVQIVGGHADASIFATNEAKQYYESGDLRVLAVLASERHPAFPNVPTAKQAGYDVEFAYNFWWFAPKGTPQDKVDYLADQLEAVMSDPDIRKKLKRQSLTPTFLRGNELEEKIAKEYELISDLAEKYKLAH